MEESQMDRHSDFYNNRNEVTKYYGADSPRGWRVLQRRSLRLERG